MARYWNHWIGRPKSTKRETRKRSETRRRLKPETLESRQMLAANIFHNELIPEDVNEDGIVSAVDALTIINQMNRQSRGTSAAEGGPQSQRDRGQMTDVNNDGRDTAVDALMVINRLNRDRRSSNVPNDRPSDPAEQPTENPSTDSPAEVRSIDGSGNNLENPEYGSTGVEFLRIAENDYADGISEPAGEDRPSAREISNALSTADSEGTTSDRDMTSFVYAWGQFLDHDITLTLTSSDEADSFNIEVPEGDTYFDPLGTGEETINLTRSLIADGTGTSVENPAQQENAITAWVDGSQVYGSDQETSDALREFVGGRMLITEEGLLPTDENGSILAGDIRAAENVVLTSMQTLFVREHNRLADEISAANPDLSDEEIYQQAREIVIAELQSITYNEYLPALLGEDALSEYSGYDSSVNPGIANEFSTAAYRFGHSTLNDEFRLVGNDGEDIDEPLSLADAFFVPDLLEETGIEVFLKSEASTLSQEVDLEVVDSLRNFLFGPPGAGGFDLASLNIQRGRDHGLADYNSTREAYGLDPVESFAEITSDAEVAAKLEALYGDVNDVDLWVGLLAEDHTEDGSLGETATAIIADQFERLRDGDRFYYENTMTDSEIREIEESTLAEIITRNTNITSLQANVFFFTPEITGTVVAESATSSTEETTDLASAEEGEPVASEAESTTLTQRQDSQRQGPQQQDNQGPGNQRLGDQRLGGQHPGDQRPGDRNDRPIPETPEDRIVAAEGIAVELLDSNGNVIDSTVTDARGNYTFDSVTQSGAYQVRIADSDEWDIAGIGTWDLMISNGEENLGGINFRVVV